MAKEKFVKAIKYDICGTLCQEEEADGAYFIRVQFDEDTFEDYPLSDILSEILGEQISIKCESAV